jgi:CPA1 family monovalent cation:H+ antiporter
MVLVLSLPTTFPSRDLLISMTFGVALLSILVQGLTMSAVLKWLGISAKPAGRAEYELRSGRLQAAAAALRELDRLAAEHAVSPGAIETLRGEYHRRLEEAERLLRKLTLSSQELQRTDLRKVRCRLLDTERDQVMQAFHQGALGNESQRELLAEIDARLLNADMEDDGSSETAAPDSVNSVTARTSEGIHTAQSTPTDSSRL